jgi:hypothetical protein
MEFNDENEPRDIVILQYFAAIVNRRRVLDSRAGPG